MDEVKNFKFKDITIGILGRNNFCIAEFKTVNMEKKLRYLRIKLCLDDLKQIQSEINDVLHCRGLAKVHINPIPNVESCKEDKSKGLTWNQK